MASEASPTRFALSNLDVNALGMPTKSTPPMKQPISRKRRINEVDEPENAPASRKLKSLQLSAKDPVSTEKAQATTPAATDHFAAPSPVGPMTDRVGENTPSMINRSEDAPSPPSTASSIDYDPDDSMESQQTAATEITPSVAPIPQNLGQQQQQQSLISQHLETLRLRLRLAQFKIQTNQINIPFSNLRLSAPARSTGERTHHSEEAEEEQTSSPTLPPLVASARVSSISDAVVPAHDPSSPYRMSKSPSKDTFRTPALPRAELGKSGRTGWVEEEGLTSCGVKGNAALGLLGLRGKP